jgi:hypothetical protein
LPAPEDTGGTTLLTSKQYTKIRIMKKQLLKLGLLCLLVSTVITACKKDKGESNEEEVITTLTLTFVPQGGGATLVYKKDDPDGPGGSNPVTDQIVLSPSKTYDVAVTLSNKTVNPVEDITEEVEEEETAHRFYYEITAGTGVTVSGLNNDTNGVPLGLASVWTTAATGSGKIKITLRHYPAVPPNKATADLVTSGKSETDIDAEFNFSIQ